MSLRLTALTEASPSGYQGRAHRQQSVGHDPRSGAGARRAGGRFNPPGSFPVLYLCLSPDCCVAELRQAARSLAVPVSALLPRELYTYEAALNRVLDLRDKRVRRQLNVELAELLDTNRIASRELGVAAFRAEWQAIICPSRTGIGDVVAVFPEHAAGSIVDVRLASVWQREADLASVS